MQNSVEPKISLFIVTSGRYDYLKRTMESLSVNLSGKIDELIMVDDSGKDATELRRRYELCGFSKIVIHETNKGFAEAYKSAFEAVSPDSDYCFILEDDFTFNEPIDLLGMASILQNNPHLCQIALKRQAWNIQEKIKGGIVECDPDNFHDKEGFCQHRKFFTTNPSLVPAWVISKGWPLCEHSEGVFTHSLFSDPTIYSAYLGSKFDPPKVHHIGETRNGNNY